MIAHILSIGNELTMGQTVDTNTAWLAGRIAALGIICTKQVTIADDRAAIRQAVEIAAKEADLVLISGGLGPTPDDLTRYAVADAMGADLFLDRTSLGQIEAFFRSRGRTMRSSNETQAMFPRSAVPIENTCGTAPGMLVHLHRADFYIMPGVPREMKLMFERDIEPALRRAAGTSAIRQAVLHTFGMPESQLGEKIADLMQRDRNPTVGTSAADLIITIRVNAQGDTEDEAARLLDADLAEIRRRLGDVVFGEDDETLAHAAAKLLIAGNRTISTAESCTGGLIAKQLTDVAGSSAYMIQGFVTYANEAKHRLLDVPMELIKRHGAVSREVAEAMATHCRRISRTDYAISTTGIAGPTGGTPEKPVGLVYIGLATPDGTDVVERRLGETLPRDAIRERTAFVALSKLRKKLLLRSQ